MEWLLAAIGGVLAVYFRAEHILERDQWRQERTNLLNRIQAQSPGVLERVHANDVATNRERDRRPARESDTHYTGVVLPPGEETIAMARQTFEELVTTS